jgi:hypothetical protein
MGGKKGAVVLTMKRNKVFELRRQIVKKKKDTPK